MVGEKLWLTVGRRRDVNNGLKECQSQTLGRYQTNVLPRGLFKQIMKQI